MNQETGNRNSREIFALFWGGADYRPKDWSGPPINAATLLEIIESMELRSCRPILQSPGAIDYRCLVFFGLKSGFPIIDRAEAEYQIRRSKESKLPRAKPPTPRFQRNNKAHKTERISPSARPATTVMTQERNASAGVKPESNRLGRRAMTYFSTGKRLVYVGCVRNLIQRKFFVCIRL
jgi:hypothetical protein